MGFLQAGAVLGIFGCSYVMEKWGRKAGFIFSATLSIVAGVLLTASQGAGMFIAFRFVAGAGSYGFFAVSKFSPLGYTTLDRPARCANGNEQHPYGCQNLRRRILEVS